MLNDAVSILQHNIYASLRKMLFGVRSPPSTGVQTFPKDREDFVIFAGNKATSLPLV